MAHILTNAKETATWNGTKFIGSGVASSGAHNAIKKSIGRAYNDAAGLTTSVSDGEVAWFRVQYVNQQYLTHYAVFIGTYDDADDSITPVSGMIVDSSSGTAMPDFDTDTNALFIFGVTPSEALNDLLVDEDWREVGAAGEPVFQNSWVNFGSPYEALYFKISNQSVYIKGKVKDGSSSSAVIFTLPEGYRPSTTRDFSIATGINITGLCRISSSGVVYVPVGGNTADTSIELVMPL